MPFYLPEIIRRLARAGAILELPPQVATWPSEVEEDALREALRGLQAELRGVAQRASELLGSLPEPEEFVHMDEPKISVADFPPSLYLKLSGAVERVAEDAAELAQAVESALAATPESLRAEWVAQNIPDELAPMIAGVGDAGAESAAVRGDPAPADDPAPKTRALSFTPIFQVAAATAGTAAMNTAIASYLRRDPFAVEDRDAVAEITRIRNGSLRALARVDAFGKAESRDFGEVAAATLETAAGGLSLALRCLELIRRRDVGPFLETELDRLEEVFKELAAWLPELPPQGPTVTGSLPAVAEP